MKLNIAYDRHLDGPPYPRIRKIVLSFSWVGAFALVFGIPLGISAAVVSAAHDSVMRAREYAAAEIIKPMPDGSLHPELVKLFPIWFTGQKDSVRARKEMCRLTGGSNVN